MDMSGFVKGISMCISASIRPYYALNPKSKKIIF